MRPRRVNRTQQIAIAAAIEMLEPRRLLAVGDFAQVVDDQLVVTGDAAANTIVVTPNETTGQLDASLDGQTLSFNPAGIVSVAIDGGDGNDTISLLSSRAGEIDSGLGDDTILSSSGADSITGSDGNDSIVSGSGDDTINGDAGNDTISGVGGADSIFGADDDDSLTGGTGADILEGGAGNDVMLGQADNDRFDDAGTDVGDDSISGGAGDDVAFAGAGADTIHLESGNDLITANRTLSDSDDDEYSGGGGEDQLDLSHGGTIGWSVTFDGVANDTIDGGTDNVFGDFEQFDADAGSDSIDASMISKHISIFGNEGNDTLKGGSSANHLEGAAGDDSLVGGAAEDVLHGSDGDDVLIGGAGPDAITAGNGDDSITANDGVADLINGSKGDDSAQADAGTDDITNVEHVT